VAFPGPGPAAGADGAAPSPGAAAGPWVLTVGLFPTQEDPALLRWAYARTQNVYPTFRPTPKTSFLGALFAVGPILFWIAVFKADRVSQLATLNVRECHIVKCRAAWKLDW